MFPLGLSLKQDEGHGFLRPVGGHGSEKIFSDDVMKPVTLMESVLRFFMGSQCNSQLHQRHISLHQSILGFENTKEAPVTTLILKLVLTINVYVLVKPQCVPIMLIIIRRKSTNQHNICGYFQGCCNRSAETECHQD
ncbi:hypothetical protein HID58_061171 [Brassica napus]|uniref:BnaCnng32870D protein n=3 Tax=Brassica TaxID=3705 RepID=A0A078J5M8_BRANA|nr:hypothetical protein HID58_061171 [Brassica napus]CAF1854896.1 unnamed protein product [Brassica napus]CDY58285.1 BnaCnng32870D [Brassica napus]VDD10269.1 unnamed protein product [Brassica oleracea]